MVQLRSLTVLAALAGALAPSTVSAATWVESLSAKPDSEQGGSGLHQDFVVTEDANKVQGLVYIVRSAEQGTSVRYTRREVEWGVPLEEGEWEISDVRYQATSNDRLLKPHLAQDAVTGTPYVAYAGTALNEGFRIELSSFVGNGNGNCGENFDWQCDNVTTACGMEDERVHTGPRLELESVLGAPADAAHVMFRIGEPAQLPLLVHARKDLANQSWTCQVVPGPRVSGETGLQSATIFHAFDGRLKPILTHAVRKRDIFQFRQVIRSLIDYAGTPLPPMSWTPLFEVASPQGLTYGRPALAIRDEGLGPEGSAMISGIGVPALAEVNAHSQKMPPWPDCSNVGAWTLDYKVATDEAGTNWEPAEPVMAGRPCGPSMAFGWDMSPHILYVDNRTNLMLTARRPYEPQLWTTPEPVVVGPAGVDMTYSDIIFDPDFGTISVVYVEGELWDSHDVVVIDGYLE